jgi:hypothetical protein
VVGILWIVAIQRLAPARPAFRFDPERLRSTEHNRGYQQNADAPLPGRDDANQRRGDDDGWVELIGSEVDALVFFVGSLFFTSAACSTSKAVSSGRAGSTGGATRSSSPGPG